MLPLHPLSFMLPRKLQARWFIFTKVISSYWITIFLFSVLLITFHLTENKIETNSSRQSYTQHSLFNRLSVNLLLDLFLFLTENKKENFLSYTLSPLGCFLSPLQYYKIGIKFIPRNLSMNKTPKLIKASTGPPVWKQDQKVFLSYLEK